ncbi:hypothetical protein [Oleiagrimonas sp. MCCC 1A03011]|uniref:hypothetical protein n=1 Tax=Oleiagrimonas sp. MCCC 1A03011 TaxID=1926883 RepID=UPI000DC448AB|nr:hypothetical protein [Oleiagrimonas sp. MCCC 1A03011]RAP57343.1 hypothetical protein BTJ49_09685 [Oleiagrimonas sp. MCCC 1A03011]
MGSTENLENQSLLIEALEAFLGSRIGVVEATRLICSACFALRQDNNPLFTPFIGINSETHIFSVGPARELWAHEALVRYDQERAFQEQNFNAFATRSAIALLAWARAQEF